MCAGDPEMMMAAAVLCARRTGGRFQVLKFSRRTGYYPVTLDLGAV